MKVKYIILVVGVLSVVAMLGAVSSTESGQDANPTIAPPEMTLKGLRGFYVRVEHTENGYFPTVDQLRTDVELRLRQAGIEVTAKQHAGWQTPRLLVTVDAMEPAGLAGLVVTTVRISVIQYTTLLREGEVINCYVETWSDGWFGCMGQQTLKEGTRDTVQELMGNFLNAYLTANPKTGKSE